VRSDIAEKRVNVNQGLTVNQALKSGANIGVSLVNDMFRYYTGDPRKSIISTISVNLVQPLMRGRGFKIVVEQLTQAERDVIYAVRDFAHFQDEFAVGIVLDYFRLLQQKDTVINQWANYQSRIKTTIYLKARQDRENLLDVSQAEQNELSAKNSYIDSVIGYRNSLDQFKQTLGIPVGAKVTLRDEEIEDLRSVGLLSLNLTGETGLQHALERYLPLITDIDRFEDQKRKIAVAADQLKADFNIFADAGIDSEGPTDYTNFDFDDVQANVGFELNLPLDRLTERNVYRTTLVNFERQIRQLEQAIDATKNGVDRGLRELGQFQIGYQIQTNAVSLARIRVYGQEIKNRAGLSILSDLLDAQDDLIVAQNAATAALVDYLEARLQLLLNVGVLDTSVGRFWLSDESVSVDLSQPATPDETLFEGDEVLPPDRIFSTPNES
jgi:outer membrane protein TolC